MHWHSGTLCLLSIHPTTRCNDKRIYIVYELQWLSQRILCVRIVGLSFAGEILAPVLPLPRVDWRWEVVLREASPIPGYLALYRPVPHDAFSVFTNAPWFGLCRSPFDPIHSSNWCVRT